MSLRPLWLLSAAESPFVHLRLLGRHFLNFITKLLIAYRMAACKQVHSVKVGNTGYVGSHTILAGVIFQGGGN